MASTTMTELGLAVTVTVQGFSLVALWLRLRWRAKQETADRRYLTAILRALPEDSKIDEWRIGESFHRLSVTRGPGGEDGERG